MIFSKIILKRSWVPCTNNSDQKLIKWDQNQFKCLNDGIYQYILLIDDIQYILTFEKFCEIGIYFKTFGDKSYDQTYHLISENKDLVLKIQAIVRDSKINSINN
jgi:hypothetical protein